MFYSNTTFIGIDPTAGQRPFAYTALDHDLRLLAVGQGEMEEVLAFVAGQRNAYVGVCAPQRPNLGLLGREDVRMNLSPPPRPGRWLDFRVAEYQLRQHNISTPQTVGQEDACPNWMRMGFRLYRRLQELDYQTYPCEGASLQFLEVYPHACYTALLGTAPFPKDSLEGRLQRQLILHDRKVEVPDAMRFFEEITRHRLLKGVLPTDDLFSPAELDALVAAYTAWAAAGQPDQVTILGDREEGQVIVPVAHLRERY